jgi:hypothetical protein
MSGQATVPERIATGDEGFFLGTAAVMVVVVIGGFLNLWLQGVTSFAAPWPVHLHAFVFMGWVGFFTLQVILAARGSQSLHRRLGWISLAYVPAILVSGTATIVRVMQLGTTPPMWTPGYFLVMNMMALISFVTLTGAAVVMRRRTDWHRRLMMCGMAALLVTPVNRLMPVPVLFAVMSLASSLVILLFPLAGMVRDKRRSGRVHPAWAWGLGTLVMTGIVTEVAGRSALAGAAVTMITQGSPAAGAAPLASLTPKG